MTNPSNVRLRADYRPLYVQATDALRSLLGGSDYPVGARLPSEPELAQKLGISRPTLREALQTLEEEGAIIRRHGVGTFVAEPKPVLDAGLEVLESVDQMAKRSGLHVEMGEVVIRERPTTADEIRGLGLAEPEPVIAVVRVILAEGRPVAHFADVLPQRFLRRNELGADFRGSVLDILLARGWPALSHSRTELLAEAANAALAHALHIPQGAPLVKLEAQLFTTDGPIADYSISYFVPGLFRFHVVRRIADARDAVERRSASSVGASVDGPFSTLQRGE